MASPWSEKLIELQNKGTITGFVLITAQGPVSPATGPFQAECAQGVSAAIQQLIRTFYEATEPPTAYEIWGNKLIVIHQTDSSYAAVSHHTRLGIVALNLPSGVLLASFKHPTLPTVVLSAVHDCCKAAFTTPLAA